MISVLSVFLFLLTIFLFARSRKKEGSYWTYIFAYITALGFLFSLGCIIGSLLKIEESNNYNIDDQIADCVQENIAIGQSINDILKNNSDLSFEDISIQILMDAYFENKEKIQDLNNQKKDVELAKWFVYFGD